MLFDCSVCGERKRIVAFRDNGTVPGTFGMKRKEPLCQECFAKPKDNWSPPPREPGCDDEEEYPF